jgi:homoserine dehydrogenase
MIQKGETADGGVFVAMTTHEGPARAVQASLKRLEGSASLTGKPMWMPILDV